MKKVSFAIPYVSPMTEATCWQGFIVGYKLVSEATYAEETIPAGDPVTFVNLYLVSDNVYDIRIQSICCNGNTSGYLNFVVDTSTNSPI